MILHHGGRHVALDDVRRAVHLDGPVTASNARQLLDAAATLGLRARGIKLLAVTDLGRMFTPCIAHLMGVPPPRPRTPGPLDGYFAVVEVASRSRVTMIDPSLGKRETLAGDVFFHRCSGVVIEFARSG